MRLNLSYNPLQIPSIFDNVLIFGGLYYAWMLLIVCWAIMGVKSESSKALPICMFALVFFGIWAFQNPLGFGTDSIGNAAYAKYLIEVGTIPLNHPNFEYFDFPGLYLVTSAITQITGLGVLQVKTLVWILTILVLSLGIFLTYRGILDYSSLAALLVFQGNIVLASLNLYQPSFFALVFFVMVLMLLQRGDSLLRTPQGQLATILLGAGATVTHLPTALFASSILLGAYLLSRKRSDGLRFPFILFFLVIPLVWQLFWAVRFTRDLIVGGLPSVPGPSVPGPSVLEALFGTRLQYMFILARRNLSGEASLWIRLTRVFWLGLVFGLGSVLGFWKLRKLSKLGTVARIEVGGFLGIFVLSILSVVFSPAGEQFYRFLQYAGFLTVPILMWSVLGHRKAKRISLIFLITALVVLSFPTFLAYNSTVSFNSIYRHDFSPGQFLQSEYGTGKELTVFTNLNMPYILSYDLPDAHYKVEQYPIGLTEVSHWQSLNELVTEFEYSANQRDFPVVYVFAERPVLAYQIVFMIQPTSSGWLQVENRLSLTNMVYANGFDQIYTS